MQSRLERDIGMLLMPRPRRPVRRTPLSNAPPPWSAAALPPHRTINDLQEDTLVQIIVSTPCRDLLRKLSVCAQVCSRWRRIAMTSAAYPQGCAPICSLPSSDTVALLTDICRVLDSAMLTFKGLTATSDPPAPTIDAVVDGARTKCIERHLADDPELISRTQACMYDRRGDVLREISGGLDLARAGGTLKFGMVNHVIHADLTIGRLTARAQNIQKIAKQPENVRSRRNILMLLHHEATIEAVSCMLADGSGELGMGWSALFFKMAAVKPSMISADEGCQMIGAALVASSRLPLKEIDLQMCNLTAAGLGPIVSGIRSLGAGLQVLDVSGYLSPGSFLHESTTDTDGSSQLGAKNATFCAIYI